MPDKPSLYVVEKKEVVILVVLFVLVTVLSFTLGVRYGESVGKKTALEQAEARRELGEQGAIGGGTLGQDDADHGEEKAGDHAKAEAKGHGDERGEAKDDKAEGHGGAEHGEPKAAAKGDSHGEAHGSSPESAAKSSAASSGGAGSSHEAAIDKNSDEYLLNALKEAGVEPPGGKAPKGAKLPEEVKEAPARKIPGGSYVIQVGSHPTRAEAEAQVRALKAKKVNAEILAPFKDKQGEWHRVVIGSYRNKRDADKEASGLKGRGSIVSFFVWRLP